MPYRIEFNIISTSRFSTDEIESSLTKEEMLEEVIKHFKLINSQVNGMLIGNEVVSTRFDLDTLKEKENDRRR